MATAGNTVGPHKIEVLTRKIQLMEEQQKERQSREVQQDLIQSQPHMFRFQQSTKRSNLKINMCKYKER